mmetsp:Transcript_15556/g.42195  ORF Transcript_15556/g.42195 Transcript_15556/m.42195 type:complete len:211 (-) Transcript_15556:439-1071(-)
MCLQLLRQELCGGGRQHMARTLVPHSQGVESARQLCNGPMIQNRQRLLLRQARHSQGHSIHQLPHMCTAFLSCSSTRPHNSCYMAHRLLLHTHAAQQLLGASTEGACYAGMGRQGLSPARCPDAPQSLGHVLNGAVPCHLSQPCCEPAHEEVQHLVLLWGQHSGCQAPQPLKLPVYQARQAFQDACGLLGVELLAVLQYRKSETLQLTGT